MADRPTDSPTPSDETTEAPDIAVLQAENASLQDRLLRALADAENVRRRADRAAQDARNFAVADLSRELLTVVRCSLDVDFLDAVNGGTRTVTLPDGSTLDVKIPPGTRDGQVLRLRGKGQPGFGEAPPGDALIEVHVRPHPLFRREGDDIQIDLPISVRDAVLGGKLRVPTPTGTVTMTIPKWSNTGAKLRLKGKGILRPDGSRGDEFVTLKIMLPEKPDPELERCIAQWQRRERTTQAAEA